MPIQRLNAAIRNAACLDKADAKLMHVASENQINLPMLPKRYNIKTQDGNMLKYTLTDDFIKTESFQKQDVGYKKLFEKLTKF